MISSVTKSLRLTSLISHLINSQNLTHLECNGCESLGAAISQSQTIDLTGGHPVFQLMMDPNGTKMDLKINEMADFLPRHWRPSNNYERQLYILVDLEPDSPEYCEVEGKFSRCPASIKRIQHPIAYLRYCVHSEYLSEKKIKTTKSQIYMAINKDDIETYINYNCDARFIKPTTTVPVNDPLAAEYKSNYVIVVHKRVSTPETDKNYYPLYLVEFS